jgi:hypothetical protein
LTCGSSPKPLGNERGADSLCGTEKSGRPLVPLGPAPGRRRQRHRIASTGVLHPRGARPFRRWAFDPNASAVRPGAPKPPRPSEDSRNYLSNRRDAWSGSPTLA